MRLHGSSVFACALYSDVSKQYDSSYRNNILVIQIVIIVIIVAAVYPDTIKSPTVFKTSTRATHTHTNHLTHIFSHPLTHTPPLTTHTHRFKVTGYPSIMYFAKGTTQHKDYDGGRTAETIVQ